MFWLAWNLLRGRVGRALVAIRDHPIAATAMGINLPMFKSLCFGTSAAFTGVAGALGGIVVAFVSPDSFTVFLSITFLVGVVVGGLASIPGAIFGAVFIQFVPNIADDISKSAPWAIYGVFLIGFMYLMPTGAMGLLHRLVSALAPRRRAAAQRSRRPHSPHPATRRQSTMMNVKQHFRFAVAALRDDAGTDGHRLGAEEVRPGRERQRDQDREDHAYCGPASAYGTIGKAQAAYFDKVNAKAGSTAARSS